MSCKAEFCCKAGKKDTNDGAAPKAKPAAPKTCGTKSKKGCGCGC